MRSTTLVLVLMIVLVLEFHRAPLAKSALNGYAPFVSKPDKMRPALCSLLLAFVAQVQAVPPSEQAEPVPTPSAAPEAADAGKGVVHALNNAFARVFDVVSPSVVVIEVTKKSDGDNPTLEDLLFQNRQPDQNPRRGPRERQPPQNEGSGFIVRPDGHIFTNHHVLEGAESIEVKLKDGREFPARLVGTDEKTDVAVIKIDANNLPAVQLGNSDDVRVGQFAFAIGAPFRLDYSFTYGVISAKGRNRLFSSGGYSITDFLQTDASINPGNSGGPLCDIDGKVIGMNTLINGINRGLGFAIPINLANEIGQQLISGQRIIRPWLGIRIETLGDDSSIRDLFKGIDKGVVVRTIEADAPAYKSDLRPFDVITHVDSAAVTTDTQLQREILKKRVGQNVELTVWRKGQTLKIPITTGELPSEIGRASNVLPQNSPRPEDTNKFGLQVQDLTKEVAARLKLDVDRGVIVTDVAENSLAAAQGIEREDVITEVDGKPVTNVQTFREALNKADPKKGVLLYLDRKGSKTFAVLKAPTS
ncbi:MAG TPA: trypsin-like peptidase domain-containing protein [Chthoniobacterales bacterium]|nr:trypsin-like peptidase domain-containing protein [Chthoniobacterales bacterium]